ncbi:MAG: Fe-S cluster assembly protein SufD [Candidatus Peribacteria bacterium]|nr:Fe-S cluster assembly protein SufD [Candidatus Peribacteria bacterium]
MIYAFGCRILGRMKDAAIAITTLSRSMHETPFLRTRRIQAFNALNTGFEQAMYLPTELPLARTVGVEADMRYRNEDSGSQPCIFDEFGAMETGGIDAAHTALFEKYVGTLLDASESAGALRHTAFLTQGFFLYVPPGIQLAAPIELDLTNVHPWAATHVVIVVGKGAKASFFEHLRSDREHDSSGYTGVWSHVVEIFAEDESDCTFTSLQAVDPGVETWLQQRTRVGSGATCTVRTVTLGGKSVEQVFQSDIVGHHGTSTLEWVFYAKGMEKQKLSAMNKFHAASGAGEITMKGIAEQKAHIACDGKINIGLKGGGTDTYLTQEVLMLDSSAKVDAVPGLEIKTNDVKASHSATVARLTEEDLFYFGARGIPSADARHLFIRGFLGDVTERISEEQLQEAVLDAIEAKMRRA